MKTFKIKIWVILYFLVCYSTGSAALPSYAFTEEGGKVKLSQTELHSTQDGEVEGEIRLYYADEMLFVHKNSDVIEVVMNKVDLQIIEIKKGIVVEDVHIKAEKAPVQIFYDSAVIFKGDKIKCLEVFDRLPADEDAKGQSVWRYEKPIRKLHEVITEGTNSYIKVEGRKIPLRPF